MPSLRRSAIHSKVARQFIRRNKIEDRSRTAVRHRFLQQTLAFFSERKVFSFPVFKLRQLVPLQRLSSRFFWQCPCI